VFRILAINPGSTSTKIGLFEEEQELFSQNLHHSAEQLSVFTHIIEQLDLRLQAMAAFMAKNNIEPKDIDAYVGRGGLLSPMPGGTFMVNDRMIQDLTECKYGEHASNLGAILACKLATPHQRPAFIVDPVVVDELHTLARYSGHPLLPRKSIFHALNHKAMGRKAAAQLGKSYLDMNLIIVHLGGGISVASHCHGKAIDVNNALDGEGPFSPERSGTLPAGDLARLCYSGQKTLKEVQKMITGKGGVVAYLGSNDMRQIEQMSLEGHELAGQVLQAMAYQVAKEIGAQAAVLSGKVDAIVLTGGIAYDVAFSKQIKERVQFIAPVLILPGEEELEALALGALRVLRNEETPQEYLPQ
jgi:butyrate kinase